MKTHTHYTTPITLAPWVRRGTAALVAVSIGLFYALSPSLNHTASAPAASAARQRIASSRVFQDEVLGADQANLAFMTSNTSASANRQPSQAVRALAARKRIASSRVFQDEVLGADQLNMAALAAPSGAFPQPMDDLRRAGPR
jgi:hypothetical protein